jgi:hypothetical protein
MKTILKNGLAAAKKNIGPGLLLQSFALILVLLYYFHEPTHQFLLRIPEIRQQMGIFFPLLASAFFGGLIPFIFLVARKEIAPGRHLANLLFMLGFWAMNGLIVSYLYEGQAILFGTQVNALTILKKVCVDQFIYNPVWGVPFAVIAMHWKRCDFSFRIAKARFSKTLFTREAISFLLATWTVWIPTVSIVYSLPLALQFPLVSIVGCFWSLLLVTLSDPCETGEKE